MEQLQEELRALELGELLQRASREGVTEEELKSKVAELIMSRTAGGIAEEGTPPPGAEKIAHLERRSDEENRKFAEQRLAGTIAERRERRFRRLVHTLEDWVGELSDAQSTRVREYTGSAPLNAELRERERRRRQAELLAMLRARDSAARLAEWAAHWDAGRDPDFAAANQAATQALLTLLADLERTLSPRQRTVAIARLREYARDFDLLAAAR